MAFVLIILVGIPLLSGLWYLWAARLLKKHQAPEWMRRALLLFVSAVLLAFFWVGQARRGLLPDVPVFPYSVLLLWSLVCLPLIALPSMMVQPVASWLRRRARGNKPKAQTAPAPEPDAAPQDPSRRRFLATAGVWLPVGAAFGGAAISIPQRNHFRIREITVPVAGLPRDLHGMRLAHLSDTHVGRFTHGRLLRDLAEATNRLKADLVLLTGDLIDYSVDDLPEAMDMLGRLDPRSGLYLIEGNHDLFQDAARFRTGLQSGGFNLLKDQSAALAHHGHPIEILGLGWPPHGAPMAPYVDRVFDQRNPDALPILLSHHPHAFDRAAELGIPLTLAGHTHGGQMMVTPEIGPGPMVFKYWSGLYRKPQGSLVVSNGCGNWFPLRTAAPAEILHLTLVRA